MQLSYLSQPRAKFFQCVLANFGRFSLLTRSAPASECQRETPPRSDTSANAIQPADTRFPEPRCGVAMEDWDILFSAVTDRLRQIGGGPPAASPGSALPDAQNTLCAGVLECVAALDQLHLSRASASSVGRRSTDVGAV